MRLLDDESLLERIAQRDEQAFTILYHRFKDKIYTYALKLCKNESDAEDIVHSVFLKMWLRSNENKIQYLDAYIETASINTCLKLIRKRKLITKVQDAFVTDWEEAHDATEDQNYATERSQILHEAIGLLSPQQKLVYQLCKEDGLSYSQAAERMEVSTFTVKTHMQVALRSLRNYLLKRSSAIHLFLVVYLTF